MSGTSPAATSNAPRGLGRGIIAFIVVDVLLVVWALGLGVSMGSSGTDKPDVPAPAGSASAPQAPVPDAAPSVAPEEGTKSVASPSGNITCEVAPSGVECGIASLASDPAPVDGCDGTQGYVVLLSSDGVSVPCVAESDRPTKADATVEVLEYGQDVTVNNFTCLSTETGMKCTDASTGEGFTLARAGITEV